jgi:hypothetical protein
MTIIPHSLRQALRCLPPLPPPLQTDILPILPMDILKRKSFRVALVYSLLLNLSPVSLPQEAVSVGTRGMSPSLLQEERWRPLGEDPLVAAHTNTKVEVDGVMATTITAVVAAAIRPHRNHTLLPLPATPSTAPPHSPLQLIFALLLGTTPSLRRFLAQHTQFSSLRTPPNQSQHRDNSDRTSPPAAS